LIVIGILGILVVAVLLTLNPAEAQRKARDNVRIRDMSKLQAVIQQYLDNGGKPPTSPGFDFLSYSNVVNGNPGLSCNGSGWLGTAGSYGNGFGSPSGFCSYISVLPDDPLVGASRTCAGPATGSGANACNNGGTFQPQPMRYRVCMDASGNFAINVRQESQSNVGRVTNDFPGAQPDSWAEVRSIQPGAVPPGACANN